MSLYQVQKLLYHVNRDPVRRQEFRRDPPAFLNTYDLTETESAAILNFDVRGLYAMGVHPLLLRPFTLLHKLSNEDYAKALKGPS